MLGAKISTIKEELGKLLDLGHLMEFDVLSGSLTSKQKAEFAEEIKKAVGSFEKKYQRWYTEAYAVIKQLLPDRLREFESYYQRDLKRKEFSVVTYTIQDWLTGVRAGKRLSGEKVFNDLAATQTRLHAQVAILETVLARFDSSLLDIRSIVQADLFDSEIDAARELLKSGFLRASGVIAGVVLERHLSEVCANHKVSIHKKNPTIADFNDGMKNADVIDVPTWRSIQHLGDLRNLCGHNKEREPRKEEVAELIDGVDKLTKSLF
jgi:hypothetical protein